MSCRTKRGGRSNRRSSSNLGRITATTIAVAVAFTIAGYIASLWLLGGPGSTDFRTDRDFRTDAMIDGCSALVNPPGLVEVGEPFRLTVKIDRGKCSQLSFRGDSIKSSRLRLTTIPLGDYVEAKLQAQDEMKVKAESVPSKPIPDAGGASWTWELIATEAGSYDISLQFVHRAASNDKDVAESNAEYFTIEAAEGDWAFFEKVATKISEVLTNATVMVGTVSALITAILMFGWKNRRTSTDTESSSDGTE